MAAHVSPTNAAGLTHKQQRFVDQYLLTGNASKAYRRAYNVAPTTSNNVVKVNASRLLDKTNVALTIANLQLQMTRETIATLVERKELLTATIRGTLSLTDVPIDHRLKAIDTLNRMENVYVERRLSQPVNITEILIRLVGRED